MTKSAMLSNQTQQLIVYSRKQNKKSQENSNTTSFTKSSAGAMRTATVIKFILGQQKGHLE